MVWVVIDRACQTIFLILALTILGLLFSNTYQNRLVDNTLAELELYKQENNKFMADSVARLEAKINSLGVNQDSYQLNTIKRIDAVEDRGLLERERLGKRVDNLNTKLNYWTGKIKKSEIEDKLKNQ